MAVVFWITLFVLEIPVVFALCMIILKFKAEKVPFKTGIKILLKNLTTDWQKQIESTKKKVLEEYTTLNNKVTELTKDCEYIGTGIDEKIIKSFDPLSDKIDELLKRHNELEKEVELLQKSKIPVIHEATPPIVSVQPSNTFPLKIYCDYGYLNSNLTGFMAERIEQSLYNKVEAGIFMITQMSKEQAFFDINENEKDSILSSITTDTFKETFEVIGSIPVNLNSVTISTTPGALVKDSNIWRIEKKIKIDFI